MGSANETVLMTLGRAVSKGAYDSVTPHQGCSVRLFHVLSTVGKRQDGVSRNVYRTFGCAKTHRPPDSSKKERNKLCPKTM